MRNILRYEFTNSPPTSYNWYLGRLVKLIRELLKVPVNSNQFSDLRNEITEINKLLNSGLWQSEKRDYVTEIREAIEKETDSLGLIIEDIEYCGKAIVEKELKKHFNIINFGNDFEYVYSIEKAVCYLKFFGYKNKETTIGLEFYLIKDVFRHACLKNDVIFIDLS